jgi:hypothetical protein
VQNIRLAGKLGRYWERKLRIVSGELIGYGPGIAMKSADTELQPEGAAYPQGTYG